MEMERRSRKPPPIERKPTMLKEFLRDDFSSCSSSGFRSFPRQSCYTSVRTLLEVDLKSRNSKHFERANPKTKRVSAFQKAINVVKQFQFSQKQSILPRSFSKRLTRSFTAKREKEAVKREIRVVVKVRDILRWRSFRDMVEEKQMRLDSVASPIPATVTTTSSNSWSDSDFTSEYLHSSSGSSDFSGENEIEDCKKSSPEKMINSITRCNHENSTEKPLRESKYEKDQFSPVSVLDFPFEEDDESSSFHSSLNSIERKKHKLMHKIRRFESFARIEPLDLEERITSFEKDDSPTSPTVCLSNSNNSDVKVDEEEDEYTKAEGKALELLKLFNLTTSKECIKDTTNVLLLDFFRDDIIQGNVTTKKPQGDEIDYELLKVAKDWMYGHNVLLDWEVEESRQVHIKEMERGGMWRRSEDENKELAKEIEVGVLNMLMDEMLFDLLSLTD